MALEYRQERKNKNEELTNRVLSDLPEFIKDFVKYMSVTKSDTTILSYTRDLKDFFNYLKITINKKEIKNFEIMHLEKLELMDIKDYEVFLSREKKLSNTTIKRKLSALSTLYKFLNNINKITSNPMLNYEYPKAQYGDIVYLNSKDTQTLLDGVLSNDMDLKSVKSDIVDKNGKIVDKKIPAKAPENVKIVREKNLLRNFAIITLLLGTGLRVAELVGIDVDDIDFDYGENGNLKSGSVVVSRKGKSMSLDRVYFGKEVALALKEYLDGVGIDMDIVKKYDENFLAFCYKNAFSMNLKEKVLAKYGEISSAFMEDIMQICKEIRLSGREVYKPKSREKSLFLTSRGSRISVRSVELIVKEAVLCYLPALKEKDKISPHKLRSTCATRLLSQTGDILLVSKQHGHSSPAVTAKFYAKLNEEKAKKKVSNLDIADW